MPVKILKTAYHVCWYAIASLIILAAVAITLLRMALPDIGEYREDIQSWVSRSMGYPVEIRDINASWEGWVPHLNLEQIRVINEKDNELLVAFEQAGVTLDLVSSLRQRDFVPYSIRISGLDLSLIRNPDGSVSLLQSNSTEDRGEGDFGKNELGQWFRNQKRIDVTNVSIRWIDQKHGLQPILFKDASIRIHSDADRMQISGSALTDQDQNTTRLEYALDIYGHLHTADWSGRIYLAADNADLDFWRTYFSYDGVSFGQTPGRIHLWTEWNDARLTQLDGQLAYDNLSINNYLIEDINGDIHLERNRNDDLLMNVDLREFTTPEGIWPGISADIEMSAPGEQEDKRIRAHISYVKLADFLNLAESSGLQEHLGPLRNLASGDLVDLNLIFEHGKQDNYFWVDTRFRHLAVETADGMHVSGLSGHISTDKNQGRLLLDSSKSGVALAGLYDRPIWLYNTSGRIDWRQTGSGLEITADNITGKTSDFDFSLVTRLDILQDEEKMIDLLVNISPVSIESLVDYLPQAEDHLISNWVKRSLLGGRLLNTDLVLRGPLSKFPFRNNEGTLQLITQIENTTLDYSPDWPPIDNLNAEISLNNSTLGISADSARIFSAELYDTVATIADVTSDEPSVRVLGQFAGNVHDCALYINQSPLNTIGSLAVIKNEELNGPLKLDLDLDIPLYSRDIIIDGTLYLPGNQLHSNNIGVDLNDLKGEVHFTRNTIDSKQLTARYFDRKINLHISRSQETGNDVQVNFTGDMDREFLRKQFNHYFPNSTVMVNDYIEHFSGSSTWQAELTISHDEDTDKSEKRLNISSDLVGMNVELPVPLAKDQTSPLTIQLNTQLEQSDKQLLDFQVGDVFAARLEYGETEDNVIDALKVNFGGDIADLTSAQGIRINGLLGDVSLSEWINLIKKNLEERGDKKKKKYHDISVDVVISRLELFNQLFTDVQLEIVKPENDWQIKVNSNAIAGLISIPAEENVIVLDLTRLHLAEATDENDKPALDIDPRRVPSIHAHVEDVMYGNKQLGEMYLETSRIDQGLSFDELTFTKPEMSINGFGEWIKPDNRNLSKFTFEINAERLNAMLSTFEFTDTAIEEGNTNISLEAQWEGRPVDFSLDRINGRLDMLIEKGQFLDINPKAGRLFGLLSLQTLPRRLALDFTDIFSKGLSFDSIQGVFTIESGNAYTNDLQLTGPSANIAVTGRTGLIEKDYDQVVTVTPQISDTLPVASALFGPIGVGVGAVIYFAGELFDSIPDQIDKILQYQYTITGSWENPVVEEIKNKSRASG